MIPTKPQILFIAKDERLKKTIKEFAELLQIPPHYLNDEITLEAVKIFVQQRIESNLKKVLAILLLNSYL